MNFMELKSNRGKNNEIWLFDLEIWSDDKKENIIRLVVRFLPVILFPYLKIKTEKIGECKAHWKRRKNAEEKNVSMKKMWRGYFSPPLSSWNSFTTEIKKLWKKVPNSKFFSSFIR